MTEIKNAREAANMIAALKLTNLFECEVGIALGDGKGHLMLEYHAVVDGLTGEEMDDLSSNAWYERIGYAIWQSRLCSSFVMDRVQSIVIQFKCRATSTSSYQVECTNMDHPHWDRIVLKKTDSGPFYAGFISDEDSSGLHTIDQIQATMCRYYQAEKLRRVKNDLPLCSQ